VINYAQLFELHDDILAQVVLRFMLNIYADEYCLCLIWVWYVLILSDQVLIIKR
jgi:hypothetical protein